MPAGDLFSICVSSSKLVPKTVIKYETLAAPDSRPAVVESFALHEESCTLLRLFHPCNCAVCCAAAIHGHSHNHHIQRAACRGAHFVQSPRKISSDSRRT